jgi:hypothetical protein
MNMRQQKQMSDCPATMYTSEAHAQALKYLIAKRPCRPPARVALDAARVLHVVGM